MIPELRQEVQYWEETKGGQEHNATHIHRLQWTPPPSVQGITCTCRGLRCCCEKLALQCPAGLCGGRGLWLKTGCLT